MVDQLDWIEMNWDKGICELMAALNPTCQSNKLN